MQWLKLHATVLKQAFERALGQAGSGTMVFVRCLAPEVVAALANDDAFAPSGWRVWRVADDAAASRRTITADRAVEIRETKQEATLLLVDTALAGAGMDGIYSAAREIDETTLFRKALRLARREVTRCVSREARGYAEQAVKKARGYGRRLSISSWTEFDFLIRVAARARFPGEYLYLLGLWPVQQATEATSPEAELNQSRMFVDHLLGTAVSGMPPARRIEMLKLADPTERQVRDLERFLRSAATRPLVPALAELADQQHLWVNALRLEGAVQEIQAIELVSWRTTTGKIAKWSGLVEEGDPQDPPMLILEPDAEQTGHYAKLEVRWKARPDNLEKDAVQYRIAVATDLEEELTFREVSHSGRKEEKCRFSHDDFSELSEDALISAKVVVSVIGNETVEPQESEEFQIRFGHPPEQERGGVGKRVRTFSEGLIELDDREEVAGLAAAAVKPPVDAKGFVLLRAPHRGKSFRVYQPPLIAEVEEQWAQQAGAIGRWRVKVRVTGARAEAAEFLPLSPASASAETSGESLWDRVVNASRRMAERFAANGGGVAQIYDQRAKGFDTVVKEYLRAWSALLEKEEAALALANTVEVQSLSGRTIGLIVLPSHPLRVAWHVAYDNLALHAAFEQQMAPKEVREELSALDGAMFPAFLPGLKTGSCFVFADTLGFHAVGMIPDTDQEPKAAVAILAKALGDSRTAETVPTIGRQSAQVLGSEIVKYVECHNTSHLLHIHALRPGDGLTVARSLGRVYEHYRQGKTEDDPEEMAQFQTPAFVLELYPSAQQRGVAGRFIGEVREKRRSGAGALAPEDQWMLESLSLSNGVNLPRLRWARKNERNPKRAAHLAVAFDTFESRVVGTPNSERAKSRPYYAFGLLSFLEREYASVPSPQWRSIPLNATGGEKHPADRTHTERLTRLQQNVLRCVARNLGAERELPVLRTDIPLDKAQSLRDLHRLCDWVITLDRNAGIEYFDSPRDNKEIYDAYVIDCVPEREDMGCLQLITSTSNLEEVRNLLDGALDQMALSRSRRNAEFLMEHLKALSGRLAIRLTGHKAPTSELIALALTHANCHRRSDGDDCWLSLEEGFFIPVDDVRDLLPPVRTDAGEEEAKAARPDLIYVTTALRKGLVFRFAEVKYRRHLRGARGPDLLSTVRQQIESLRDRWANWYSHDEVCSAFRAIRRAKLARVLRFYADKAHRHGLPEQRYREISAEIDRMVEKGGGYALAAVPRGDRGWVFCPEYTGVHPLEISPGGWDTRIFLFGPALLPDSGFLRPWAPATSSTAPRPSGAASTTEADKIAEDAEGQEATPESASSATKEAQSETATDAPPAPTTSEPHILLGMDLLTGGRVEWPLRIKGNPHLLIAGLPGMGKTTCLLNLCAQMLEAGVRPIVFSYHQDIDQELERLAGSVRFVDFCGLNFNPLQVMDRGSRLAYLDIAGTLRDIFVAIFPELGDLQGEYIRNAIKKSFHEQGWDDPEADPEDLSEPEFGRFVTILRDTPNPERGLKSLLARLGELADYGFFDLAKTSGSLWENNEPVVVRIHKTQNDCLQKAFASLVFYGLYKDMFRRGIQDRITHAVIFDEAHRAAKLTLIPTMAKECRKYGISLVLASQEAKDFQVSVFSAIANYLVLRLTEADAKVLVRNVARSDQERMLMDRIKQMERFKGLYFSEARDRPARVALLPVPA